MTRTEMLLVKVGEECNEVAHRCAKAMRFGLGDVQRDQPLSNAERIVDEYLDLVAAMILLSREDGAVGVDPDGLKEILEAKRQRIERYLEYSKTVGCLE